MIRAIFEIFYSFLALLFAAPAFLVGFIVQEIKLFYGAGGLLAQSIAISRAKRKLGFSRKRAA